MARYASLFTANGADKSAPQEEIKAPQYRILLVDDEVNVLKALERVFRQENYAISLANNGQEALSLLYQENYQLMICDYKMPGMSGAELLKRVKAMHPDMIRIMLTGHADTGAVMGAIEEGAVYKFILKPWNDDDLRITVALALEQYDLKKENKDKAHEITALSKLAVTNRSQLAMVLHKRNLLTQQQVQELHKLQQSRREPIIKLLLERDWVSEKIIRDVLRKDLLVEELALNEVSIDPSIAALVPHSFCER